MYALDYLQGIGILLSAAISMSSPFIIIVCSHYAVRRCQLYESLCVRMLSKAMLVMAYGQCLSLYISSFMIYTCYTGLVLTLAAFIWIASTVLLFLGGNVIFFLERSRGRCFINKPRQVSNCAHLLLAIVVYLQVLAMPLTLAGTNPGFSEQRVKSKRRICLGNMKSIDMAIMDYNKEHANGGCTGLNNLVPKYIIREPICPLADGRSYIITNGEVICPVMKDYPDHSLR